MKYYKFMTDESRGEYSGFDFSEYLPKGDHPGAWLPEVEGKLVQCKNGYHACGAEHLVEWINAQLYEVEYRDQPDSYGDKVNGRQLRFVRKVETWNDRSARLFAVWCAREALSLIDETDPRCLTACDVAERYANGDATEEELAAARAAAWAAARDAACDAARAAARAAACDAAWAAAWAAARAAWDAQNKKLVEMLGL